MRSFVLSCAGLACLSLPLAAAAQVKADGQWRGLAGAAVTANAGNSSSQAFSAQVDLVNASAADKITLGGIAQYARSKAAGTTSTTANKWAGSGQYDFNLGPRLFAFGKLGLEGDELADLDLRATLGAGLGFKLIDTKETSFSLFGGAGYTTDQYATAKLIDGRRAERFSRASLLLGEESSHALSATTSFKQRLELYPGLSGDKALLARFTAGLGVAMSSTLNLTVGLTAQHNSQPPAGMKSSDLTFFTGVSMKLGAN